MTNGQHPVPVAVAGSTDLSLQVGPVITSMDFNEVNKSEEVTSTLCPTGGVGTKSPPKLGYDTKFRISKNPTAANTESGRNPKSDSTAEKTVTDETPESLTPSESEGSKLHSNLRKNALKKPMKQYGNRKVHCFSQSQPADSSPNASCILFAGM
jgi:hypothetical protein